MTIFNTPPKPPIPLIAAIVLALLIAGGLYANKVYKAPEAPPNIIYTLKGPVVLYPDAQLGDLITAPNFDTIYYLNQEGKRVVFPDEQTFSSWYGDFTAVKTVPRDVLESYPLSGRNATIRPGTYLVTIESSPQVWMVGFPNNLFWLAGGEPQVKTIFGEQWLERLVDIPEYYFGNYAEGADLQGTAVFPPGTLVRVENQYYLITPSEQRPVTEQGMEANHFQERFAIDLEQALTLPVGPALDEYEPVWGSPDATEQRQEESRVEININGLKPEIG